MVDGKVSVSELASVLSCVPGGKVPQIMVWIILFLTMATSVLGVGMELCDSIEHQIKTKFQHWTWISVIVAVCYFAITEIFDPGTCSAIRGCPGMILSVLAILLSIDIYLLEDGRKSIMPRERTRSCLWAHELSELRLCYARESILSPDSIFIQLSRFHRLDLHFSWRQYAELISGRGNSSNR
jgi:hypothetical protein